MKREVRLARIIQQKEKESGASLEGQSRLLQQSYGLRSLSEPEEGGISSRRCARMGESHCELEGEGTGTVEEDDEVAKKDEMFLQVFDIVMEEEKKYEGLREVYEDNNPALEWVPLVKVG